MRRLFALFLLLAVALPAGLGRAQPGPELTLFDPGLTPPTPPPAVLALPATTATIAQAGASEVCYPLLNDSQVSISDEATSPWREYRRRRFFADDSSVEPYSPPFSIAMEANRDGDPGSGADVDAVGQEITITSTASALQGELFYYYAEGTPGPGDELRVQLYEVGNLGAGGLITTAAVLTEADRYEGNWESLAWEVTDVAVLDRLRDLGRAALVVSMVSEGNPGATRLWLDDLTADQCVPAASVRGRVTRAGEGVEGALVALVSSAAGGSASVIARTRSASDGSYTFGPLPVQPAGTTYRVWFLNQPAQPPRDTGMLGFWAGPRVPQLGEGDVVGGLDFEVGDLPLQSPASYAEPMATDAAPAVLRWGARVGSRPGERHQLCLYDPARGDIVTRLPAQICGPIIDPNRDELSFSLGPGSFTNAPGFAFSYGRSYRWYVIVYASDPRNDPSAEYGYSFGERAITLHSEPVDGQTPAPSPEPGEPAQGVAGADWTLLVYMAADNTIGDERRAPNLGRPTGQLAALPALAAAYPLVNLVSYVDSFGPGGAELCVYPPGGPPDCRRRAEVDSADPLTLASFIAYGRSRYPAAHTALLIVAPGQAAGQLALDETAAGAPSMSLAQLETAYQSASLGGATRLDLVIYQVPLLGTVETLQITAPYARYMVASPGQIWQLGPYRELVPLMAGASKDDLAAVARGAAEAYGRTIAAVGGARANVWAAYDLGRAEAFGQALDGLAEALDAALTSEATATRPALVGARAAAQSYDASGNGRLDRLATAGTAIALEEDALVDLRDLAGQLQPAAGPPDYVRQQAAVLAALLDDPERSPVIAATVSSGLGSAGALIDYTRAQGLAIFFPSGDRFGGQATLAETYLHQLAFTPPGDSLWADMLRKYLAGLPGTGPGGVTEGAAGGYQLRPMPGGFVSTTLYLPQVWR